MYFKSKISKTLSSEKVCYRTIGTVPFVLKICTYLHICAHMYKNVC